MCPVQGMWVCPPNSLQSSTFVSAPCRPNPGFMEQLELWGAMRCRIDISNKLYKSYQLLNISKTIVMLQSAISPHWLLGYTRERGGAGWVGFTCTIHLYLTRYHWLLGYTREEGGTGELVLRVPFTQSSQESTVDVKSVMSADPHSLALNSTAYYRCRKCR